MASSQDPKNGGFSARILLLGALIAFCALMSLMTVYVKYRLDRSESALSAPNEAFSPDQKLYEKTILSLGYGGFLGSAQTYMRERDHTALQDMRMNYKTAQESLIRLGDKTSTSVRRDIRAILDIFAGVITKAEEGSDALNPGLTNADMLTATSALSALEMRLSAALAGGRIEAESHFKVWSLALMMLALSGFTLAISLSAWGLLSAGGKRDEDISTLAQSVSNLVHGDIQKPVWGIERTDKVGELARTIDLARMYFTQVPDISVMGQDGPIRLKFEGESKSLFQAMMRKVTESFERAQQSSLGFTGTMSAQQELMKTLVAQTESALEEIQRQGRASEDTMRALTNSLAETAVALNETQESGAQQIANLVPLMKDRIQNMAEITHLAGSQVTQSLQALMKSENALRQTADQSQYAVKQLSQTTSQMGERMFAALNLMQATSKALGETIDSSQTRFNEAVSTLARGESSMTKILSRAEERLTSSINAEETMSALVAQTASGAEKLEKLVNAISHRHETVDEQILTAAHRMDSIVANFDSAQRAMNESAAQIRRDGSLLASILAELRANNDQLLSTISQNSQMSFTAAQSMAEKSHALMQRLEVQIEQQAQMAESRIDEMTIQGQTMAQQATTTTSSLSQAVLALKNEQEKLATSRTKLTETIADLGSQLERHATSTFGKTEKWAAESFSKISSITEQMESFMGRLAMLGQLTGTLGTVAGQLGQVVPALTQMSGAHPALPAAGGGSPVIIDMEGTKTLIVEQTEGVIAALHDQWHEAVLQMEAMHDQLAQIVIAQKDQLETRLVVMDKKLRETSETMAEREADLEDEEKRAQIINEVIAAISKINEHVLALDGVIEEAGLKNVKES